MDGDVLFLIGMAVLYLLRRISSKKREQKAPPVGTPSESAPSRQTPLQIPQRGREPAPLHYSVDMEPGGEEVLSEGNVVQSPVEEPTLATLLGQLLGTAEERSSLKERASSAQQREDAFESAAPVGSSDNGFFEMTPKEWHTESRDDWTDQTSDFDFHSTIESENTPHDSHRARSFVERKSKRKDQAAVLAEKQSDSPAPVKQSSRIRTRLSGKTDLQDAIILQLILGPPVSLRTRSVRRRLS